MPLDENTKSPVSTASIELTQKELLLLSNALLRAMAENSVLVGRFVGIERDQIIRQIEEANETLRALNSKICKYMND